MKRRIVVPLALALGLVVIGIVLIKLVVPLGFIAYLPTEAHDVDVSDQKELWGEYAPEHTYMLNISVYIKTGARRSVEAALVPPRGGGEGNHLGILKYRSPGPIQRLEKLEDRWPKGIGIVERGTRIQCVRILAERSLATFDSYPVGQLVDGRHAGELVDMTDVSEFCPRQTEADACLAPDKDILSVVPSNAEAGHR